MWLKILKRQNISPAKNLQGRSLWLIVSLFILVLVLEFFTPVDCVFGYLYTGPILLATSRQGRSATFYTTLVAVVLTILNLWIPGGEAIEPSTVANRSIAAMALIVTGILSDRNSCYSKAIAQQQAKLQAQDKIALVREDFASTLTHDLKTPLLGAIETLKAFDQEKFGAITPTHHKVLATMIRSVKSTLQLVETLLDVYRNDIEGLKLHLAPVDLVAIANDAIALLTDLATSRQVYISLGFGESDFRRALWVNGDALQLQRASGYCLKGIPAETLILAIRSVAAGASWWDQTATTQIRATFENSVASDTAVDESSLPLTRREQEILALIAAGKSNQEIAEILYITPGTVRVHVHTIIQKLGVRDAYGNASRTHSSCCISNSKKMGGGGTII